MTVRKLGTRPQHRVRECAVTLRTRSREAGLRLSVPADWPGLQEVGGERAASVIVGAARLLRPAARLAGCIIYLCHSWAWDVGGKRVPFLQLGSEQRPLFRQLAEPLRAGGRSEGRGCGSACCRDRVPAPSLGAS